MPETHMPVTAHQVEKLRTQLAFLLRDGQHYRAVLTDSESSDGVMLVCTSPDHPADDQLAQWGVYDCCDADVFMELRHEKRAAFFVSATIAIPALLAEREQLAGRVAELEALLAKPGNRMPGCNHGPDMQCVACVPDDGFSFRPLGLGPAGSAS